ncbi:MAG TPA: hypothetical protein EYQ01_10975, partial [Nitrospira sp.]|nr:hypothetical protein [Candidatus Manganitrophaceae bacterium]
MKKFYIFFIVFFLMLTLQACGGGGGVAQVAGGGNNSVAARSAPLPVPDIDCPTGGILVETGIDENGNGFLDAAEVDQSEKLCNGATGATGAQALLLLSDEPIGPNCSFGGVRIDSGLDSNINNTLDPSEITETKFVCTPARALFEAKEKLVAFDAGAGDQFGFSVSISGDYAIVGAVFEAAGGGIDAGAAYLYHRTGLNTWDAGVKILAPDAGANDFFG